MQQAQSPGAARAIDLIRASDLFSSLDEAAAARIASHVAWRRYRADEVVFHEGDAADRFHVIDRGRVRIIVSSEDGREGTLAVLKAGDAFGELALLDGTSRSATAIALEPTETVTLDRDAFESLLAEDPVILKAVLANVARWLRRLTSQVADLYFLDLRGRVVSTLVRMARETEPGDVTAVTLPPLTQSELAALVAGTRQRVNGILADLVREGLISQDGRRITIPDVESLAERTTW
jgi:CRP/FNR family transcriptional regulator, cyclic AMP receptor protein